MNCLGIARKVCLVAGKGDSENSIAAFDSALLDAKINDYNIIAVSSILAKETGIVQGFEGGIEKGSFVPCVISRMESSKKGEKIASAVAAAMFRSGIGFVAALSSSNTRAAGLREQLAGMLELAAKARNTEIAGKAHFAFIEHTVKKCGCTIAAAVYLF